MPFNKSVADAHYVWSPHFERLVSCQLRSFAVFRTAVSNEVCMYVSKLVSV